MDDRAFVTALMAVLPEAFAGRGPDEFLDDEDAFSYAALAYAFDWMAGRRRDRAAVDRFWGFVEQQARAHERDTALETLIWIECFEDGRGETFAGHLGPRTRVLARFAPGW